MNERDWADRFSRDVNGLLNEARRTDSEPLPTEYRQALDLARTLATTDFSVESRVRQALRRRLLNRIGAREEWPLQRKVVMRTFFWQRHPAVTLAALALTALLVVTLAWPGALTTMAQGIQGIRTFVQTLGLGRHATVTLTVTIYPETPTDRYTGPVRLKFTVQQINPTWTIPTGRASLPTTPVVGWQGDLWIIRTAIGNFAGNVLPDRDATVQRFRTFDEAQAAVSFSLRQPGYLPAGYALREAMLTPLDWAFLFYGGPDGDIVLTQMPVGERPGSEARHFTSTIVEVLTDKPIESVTLNGQPAGWIEGYGLIWEADSASYILGGAGLSLDEATRIAESLE